jgi:hypothetical protein
MADEEESHDTIAENNVNDVFYRGLANRKLKDQTFSRDEKTMSVDELCVKFSLNDESLKRLIHYLRTSLVREIKAAGSSTRDWRL